VAKVTISLPLPLLEWRNLEVYGRNAKRMPGKFCVQQAVEKSLIRKRIGGLGILEGMEESETRGRARRARRDKRLEERVKIADC
jgi:hypothetical protein